MEYCLLDVGIRQRSKAEELGAEVIPVTPFEQSATLPSSRFTHQGKSYLSLLDESSVAIKSLIRDVSRVPEYRMCERSDLWDSSSLVLSVFMRMPHEGEAFDYGCFNHRKRLQALLFTDLERRCFVEEELERNDHQTAHGDDLTLTVSQFYEQLRLRHRDRQASKHGGQHGQLPETIEHSALRPQLRPYQQEAVRWLIERETVPLTLPAQYVRLQCATVPEVDFYMDLYTYAVQDTEPPPIPIPAGGILADEMGLGKTVEILALLLFNRRPKDELVNTNGQPSSTGLLEVSHGKKQAKVMCLCRNTHRANTIGCQKCGRLQHRKCVLKHHPDDTPNRDPFERYLCPECWRSEPLVESGATIIVSPTAIKHQWASEIQKHISCPNFRVFLYSGVSESYINPLDLASYDVVVTDYNVLKSEIYFTSENGRNSRHEKRFLSTASPLTMIRWWRVCLDEAQMVEGLNTNATRMVKALPAVHRWTVTGTPIEKTIDNLYGLVHYLDYEPYNIRFTWCAYMARFQQGNAVPLLDMMVRIMWRTCKQSVLDQLGIPPQTERVHYVTMTDLQRHFYRTEHSLCASAFHEKAQRIERTLSMAQMNIQTLNKLMEPLRKLRHDCTIPSVLHVANTLPMKKLLTPAELHEHLVANNVNECKGQLRSVVSSLNGMAAVQLLLGEPCQALRLYEASLRMADDYKTGTITVDSLLQIHALHNLLDLVRTHVTNVNGALDGAALPDADKIREYEDRCAQLERRYIDQYASKVRAVETDLFPAIAKLEATISQSALRLDGAWWRDVFQTVLHDSHRSSELLYRLLSEIPMEERPAVHTFHGLDLWLTTWWDKITERRQTLKEGFAQLSFFIESLQPDYLCSSELRTSIDRLVKAAFACHLDPSLCKEGPDEEGQLAAANAVDPCLLCTVKDKLNHLEAVLFLTKQTQAATGGLWQISHTELMLKHLLNHVKRTQDGWPRAISTEGDHCLTYLEQVKQEFKEYSRYWVELNYTVAAYDEISMCKSRLQLISKEELKAMERLHKKRSLMQLLPGELAAQMEQLQQTKEDSQRSFVRLQGTLKYLAHLGQKTDIDPCPICQLIPDKKYVVLQCGHHCCNICIITLVRMAHNKQLACVVCRHRQPMGELQYVTLQNTESRRNRLVRGNYSAKIQTIVSTTLDLMEEEKDVKIVIFSHWEPILVKLEEALVYNGISCRQKSHKSKNGVSDFKDFKLAITCLLLPLQYGSKGLNLTEATHVFLVEPILNPGEELQAIGRIHRIGQTRPTFVHRFIVNDTIEETIYETIQKDQSGRWLSKDVTVQQLEELFYLKDEQPNVF